MVKTAIISSQLLRFFPKTEFSKIVKKHESASRSNGSKSWSHFVSMLFCQLGGAEICTGLSCCLGKLRHPGVDVAPNKSTLSYAHKHRPAAMFEDLLMNTLAGFR